MTAKERMHERIANRNEARALAEMEKENEPDVDCSMRLKALWMVFSLSLLPKAFIVVGSVVFIFGIAMLIVGFATDSFNDGQTVGPALAAVGIVILVIGILGFRTAKTSQRKVTQERDPEQGLNKKDKEENGIFSKPNKNEKTNQTKLDNKIPDVLTIDHNDKESDSDVDIDSKPIARESKTEKKKSISGLSNQDTDIPVVGVARPRTLPPLQMPLKPVGTKKKRKSKTPRGESNNLEEVPTISSGLSYGVSGYQKYYGEGDDEKDDDWTNYRSKTFNYE